MPTVGRVPLALVLTAVLCAFGPLSTHAAGPDSCSRGDVTSIANAGVQFSEATIDGTSPGERWERCQVRAYDWTPHTITSNDYFLVGLFLFWTNDEIDTYFAGDRAAAVANLRTTTPSRLFIGPAGDTLIEVPLRITGIRYSVHDEVGHMLWNSRYHILPAGSLAPGAYEWRWEQTDPLFGNWISTGTLTVLPS